MPENPSKWRNPSKNPSIFPDSQKILWLHVLNQNSQICVTKGVYDYQTGTNKWQWCTKRPTLTQCLMGVLCFLALTRKIRIFWKICKAGNTLESPQVRTTSHRTKLLQRTSVYRTNNLSYTLWTCLCAVQTWSNHCCSTKVSIILCKLSAYSFFVGSIASVANRRINVYSIKILLWSLHLWNILKNCKHLILHKIWINFKSQS